MGQKNNREEKMPFTFQIVALIVSTAAFVVSVASIIYTVTWNRETRNLDSYLQPLNYNIDYGNLNDSKTLTVYHEDNHYVIKNERIVVTAQTGAIKQVYGIFYWDHKLQDIEKASLLNDLDHADHYGSDLVYKITDLTMPVFSLNENDLARSVGDLYGCVYIMAEGFQNDYDITPVLFCYHFDGAGKVASDYEVKFFSEMDLLYLQPDYADGISEIDRLVLENYADLKDHVDELYKE